jgi:hypothetical protein
MLTVVSNKILKEKYHGYAALAEINLQHGGCSATEKKTQLVVPSYPAV